MTKNPNGQADETTARQWRYLFYVHTRRGKNRSLAACADYFGISRSGAYKAFDALEAKGLVLRGDDGPKLTARARAGLRPLSERAEEIAIHFGSFGYSDERARDEAAALICSLPDETTRLMTARLLAARVLDAVKNATNDASAALPDGVYPICDFAVYDANGNDLSKGAMGSDGFRRPAMFVLARGACALELRAQTIRVRLSNGKTVQGTLSRLWYRNLRNGGYEECVAFRERWCVPGGALTVTREGDAYVFRLRFRADAEASCNMPKASEGELVFAVSAKSERMPLRKETGKGRKAKRADGTPVFLSDD
jgi:Mn-dependent DtxR family transcriptional regulator